MVFHDNLGGPEPFIPIDNTATGSGQTVTCTPAVANRGGVYQVLDFTTTPWTVGDIGAGTANSTDGFLVCGTIASAAAGDDISATGRGLVRIRFRRAGTGTFSKGAGLYCTEGAEWVTPTANAHTSTSGRLCAVLWEDLPAGSDGDYVEALAVFRGAPPHVA